MKKKTSTKDAPKKRIVLLDMHAILHRAYHALPDFASSAGEPTGALYGLSAMVFKIATDFKPDYVIACYDLPQATFRHEAYDGYKAKRLKTEDALISQINRSYDVCEALNIPIYKAPGFEADDLLGTIVEKTKDDDSLEIIIASGDMDTLQLVTGKKVQVYTLKKGINDTILYDEEKVIERFGFVPTLLPDYKGLRGDPSDNIIGIKGIGEKTATEIISKYNTIEGLYEAIHKDKEAVKKNGFSERIVGLIEAGEEEARFSKTLATIRRDATIDFKLPEVSWREGIDLKRVANLFGELEFRTLRTRAETLFGAGESADTKEVEEKDETGGVNELDERKLGIAVWLLNSNLTNPNRQDILEFAKCDDLKTAQKIVLDEIKKQNLTEVYEKIELPLIPVLDKMNKWGIKIDTKFLAKLSESYHARLSALESSIYLHAGDTFNINSPKQLGEVLFEKMGLAGKRQKKTATGQLSTRESELEKLKDVHPIINDVLAYRELQKLLSTYIDTLPTTITADDRLHTTLCQTGSTTGRMASLNPNLQNIPIKTEDGRAIREAFIAEKGFTICSLDYSQIELRIAAFLSKDQVLCSLFRAGGDIHESVAAEVFGVSPKDVDKEMRRKAKVINFGILYGMGVSALKDNLGTTREEAQTFYNNYFEKFKGLAQYLDHTKAEANRLGYTETFFGRRRHFEGIRSHIPFIRASAERMAINAPIQGTSADIIKLAMIEVDRFIEEKKWGEDVRMLLQVHDELLFEVKNEMVDESLVEIKRIMENVLPTEKTEGVPLIVGSATGVNWGSLY